MLKRRIQVSGRTYELEPPDAGRANIMKAVRRRDTVPEKLLRSALHRRGLRFRIDVGTLPGRPDVWFPTAEVAIFVHGCFWHAHQGCPNAPTPKRNIEFWHAKLRRNVERDAAVADELRELGYEVLTVWECDLKRDLPAVVEKIIDLVRARKAMPERDRRHR